MVAKPSYYYDQPENGKNKKKTEDKKPSETLKKEPVFYYKPTNNPHSIKKGVPLKQAVRQHMHQKLIAERKSRFQAGAFYWLEPDERLKAERTWGRIRTVGYVSKRALREKLNKFPLMTFAAFALPTIAYGVHYMLQNPDQARTQIATSKFVGLDRYIDRPKEVTIKTCNAIKYLNKIDWKTHQRINYFPGSTFIVCHPDFRLSKSRFYAGTFQSTLPNTLENYTLLSQKYHLIFPTPLLHQFSQGLDRLSDFTYENKKPELSRTQLSKLRYWQQPFCELDSLPVRIQHCFKQDLKSYRPKTQSRIAEPLFDLINKHSTKEIPLQKSKFLRNYLPRFVIEHESFLEPHVERLSEALINSNPGSHIRFAGNHRRIQYKIANTFSVLKDILACHVHTISFLPGDLEHYDEDEKVEIDVYATKELSLPYQFNKYTEKQSKSMPSLNDIDFRLKDAFQSDAYHFNEQEADLYVLSNAYDRPTSGLYSVTKPIKRNPFNLIYKNQRKLLFDRKYNHSIIPEFQEVFLNYLHKELKKVGLPTKRTTALNFYLKPAISKPYRYKIQGARIRKYGPRLSSNGYKLLKTRIMEADSCLLKRKVSGYLFPDTPSQDIWLKALHWKNRFFIEGSAAKDDIFIRLVGTPDLGPWIYKQLIQKQLLTNDGFNDILFSKPRVAIGKERGNFKGLVNSDMGRALADKAKVEPRNYRYPDKNWVFWIDEPLTNFDKRNYDVDPDKRTVLEEDESQHPNLFHEDDAHYLASNQRCLPLPMEPAQPINTVNYKYRPKFETVNHDFHTFKTVYNVAHKQYSEYGQMIDENPVRIFNYGNRFTAKLHAKWSFEDPVFYAYMAIIAYLAFRARMITHNYINSFWENLEGFLNHLEVRNLFRFHSLENFVVYPGDLTLAQMVGGRDHMDIFFPFIKFIRRQRFNWTEIPIPILPDFPRPAWEYVFNEQQFRNDYLTLQQQPNHPTLRQDPLPILYSREMAPKGILLVGSPGTGKTFFVRALAGACNCPIIRYKEQPRSGARHTAEENDQFQKTTVVKRVFKTAKFRSPSIVFIDELDTLGAKRTEVLGSDEILSRPRKLYYTKNALVTRNAFTEWQKLSLLDLTLDLNKTGLKYRSIFHPRIIQALFTPTTDFITYKPKRPYTVPKKKLEAKKIQSNQRKVESVTILLCLLDGLQKRENVIFMGATNRPKALDPALTRPGRLEKVIYLDLPNQQKRFQLLRMYSQGAEQSNIDWEFFSGFNQTGGLSPAHIKASMNLATLSLIKKSFDIPSSKPWFGRRKIDPQTNLTIQHGIESVKYRDMYLKSVIQKTVQKLNRAGYSKQMNVFLESPSKSIHLSQNVELRKTENHIYLVNSIKGINVPTAETPQVVRSCRPKPTKPLTAAQRVARKVYAKHAKQLRLLYLLTPTEDLYLKDYVHYNGTSVLPPKFGIDRLEQMYLGRPKQRKILHAFKRYMNRVVKKPTLLASMLLMDTSYSLRNPLLFEPKDISATIKGKQIKSNFKWAHFSKQNITYYNMVTSKNSVFFEKTPEKTVEKWQQDIFGDHLALKRAAYYTAAKALIISLLDDTLCDSITLSLWSNIKPLHEHRSSQQTFLQLIAKQLITKKQFEQYLLSLIAGKVGEHFFLMNQGIENQSDLGIAEIQQMGWLANIMVEKNLFYSGAPSRALQTIIPSVSLPINDKQKRTGKSNPNEFGRKQRTYRHEADCTILDFWWRPKLAYERDNFCLQNGIWTKYAQHGSTVFHRKQPEIEFAHPWHEGHAPFDIETYQNIRPRTELKQRMLEQSLNQDVLQEILESSEINWSSIAILKSQPLFAQLILESFSKAFNILEANRPLLDYFIHRFYRQKQITGIEAKRITDEFLQQITDPAILEQIKTKQMQTNETEKTTETEKTNETKKTNEIEKNEEIEVKQMLPESISDSPSEILPNDQNNEDQKIADQATDDQDTEGQDTEGQDNDDRS